METQLEQIREQQKDAWNKFSPGWRKWDDFTMLFLKPMGEEIIQVLNLKDTDIVLDVAAGTGEPGLTIAAIVSKGKVVMTDVAEGMLNVARDNAAKRGIENYEIVVSDVCELPFENETFDAISCRFGFMFFPDMLLAAKEMVRVLKPGGKIATAVWGMPADNFWVTATRDVLNKNMQLPVPPPDAPGMFRCGSPGFLAHIFRQVGLKNVVEKDIKGTVNYGSSANYWTFMNEVVPPVVAAMSKADDAMKQKIEKEVLEFVDERYPDKNANLDYGAMIVVGEK